MPGCALDAVPLSNRVALPVSRRSPSNPAPPGRLPASRHPQIGFYNSVRVLVFWGFMLVASVWGLSLFMAISAIARSHAVAIALQVSLAVGWALGPRCGIAVLPVPSLGVGAAGALPALRMQ